MTPVSEADLEVRIQEIKVLYEEKEQQINLIHREQAELDKELRNLEFIKNSLK